MRVRRGLKQAATLAGVAASVVRRARKGQLGTLEERRRLAQAVGVTLGTVTRWQRTGVPEKREIEVSQLLADRQAAAMGERDEKKRVRQLLSKARKRGVIAKRQKKGLSRFGGKNAIGKKTVTHLDRYLDDETLTEIEGVVQDAPKDKHYIVTVDVVEAGITAKVRGYGGIMTQKLGKQAENIAFSSAITSGTHTGKRKALLALFKKLEGAIEDSDSLIYVNSVLVFSYRYRDEL